MQYAGVAARLLHLMCCGVINIQVMTYE